MGGGPSVEGMVVVVTGPDGTGKSSICDALETSAKNLGPVLRLHHRPSVLPNRSPTATVTPHKTVPYGKSLSVLKIIYLFFDYVLGSLIRVRPTVKRGGLILMERGWWDLLVDPLRYRLRPTPKLVKILGSLLPAADVTLICHGNDEVIGQRKSELPLEELRRQLSYWRDLEMQLPSSAILDVDDPLPAVVATAEEFVVRARISNAKGAGSRWLRVPRSSETRWWLPAGRGRTIRASLSLVHPMTQRARLTVAIARKAASLPLLYFPWSDGGPPLRVLERIDAFIPVGGRAAIARSNHRSRFTVLLLGPKDEKVGMAKIALDDEGAARLEKERLNLVRFGSLLPAPLLAPIPIFNDEGILLLEFVEWKPRPRPWLLPDDVAFALGGFFVSGVAGPEIASGLCHGDVAPWNLLHTSGSWVLVDWEEALPEGPAFYDLFHFFVQSHILLGRPTYQDIRLGLEGEGSVGHSIAAFSSGAKRDTRNVGEFFKTYLELSQQTLRGLDSERLQHATKIRRSLAEL